MKGKKQDDDRLRLMPGVHENSPHSIEYQDPSSSRSSSHTNNVNGEKNSDKDRLRLMPWIHEDDDVENQGDISGAIAADAAGRTSNRSLEPSFPKEVVDDPIITAYVVDEPSQSPTLSTVPNEHSVVTTSQAPLQPPPLRDSELVLAEPMDSRGNKWKKIGAALLVILIAAVVAVAVVIATSGSDDGEDAQPLAQGTQQVAEGNPEGNPAPTDLPSVAETVAPVPSPEPQPTLKPTVTAVTVPTDAPMRPTMSPMTVPSPVPQPTLQPTVTTVIVPSPTNPPGDAADFVNTLSLRDFAFDESGGFLLISSSNPGSSNACLDSCASNDAARYASSVSGDTCLCYDILPDVGTTCAVPWGDQVDSFTIASGTLYFKEPVAACTFDWCDANPDHWFCLTANTLSLRDFAFDESGGFVLASSSNPSSENDCLDSCSANDAARYASSVSGDKCLCYDILPDVGTCAIPWGDQVDRFTIASGTLYFKGPVSTCTFDWCDANPDHWFCLTANTLSLRDFAFDESGGFVMVSSSNPSSENDCLDSCGANDAARYASSVSGDKCLCYDVLPDVGTCAIPWGDQVDRFTIASGTLYFKGPVSTCTFDWCDANPDHWFCLTANTLSLRDFAFDESGGFVLVSSSNPSSENDCLDSCSANDAARYASSVTGDQCLCYDVLPDVGTTCAVPWGDQVDRFTIASGTLYFKEPVAACSFDWCEEKPEDSLCL